WPLRGSSSPGHTAASGASPARSTAARSGRTDSTGLALARGLLRVLRHRHGQVQRGADDPRLLLDVGDRIALARRCALGPPDVAEAQALGEHLQQARRHVRAGAHVARLLLDPDDLAQVGVAVDELEDLLLGERIEQLDTTDRHARVPLAVGVADDVVVDLARAEDDARDLVLVDARLGEHG